MKKTFIILGASGDLARKKLYPALYGLFSNNLCFDEYIGYGRTTYSNADFQRFVAESLSGRGWVNYEEFLNCLKYISGSYDKNGIAGLKEKISESENTFYLALPTSYELVSEILAGLHANKLINRATKIVLEKPFGNNFSSAKKLNDLLLKYLDENQIYRIDHYLAKDLVRDLLTLRFSNSIFEPLWNNKYIQDITIQIKEKDGIENRGEFYDKTGVIRDVIQNHAIQLLALTMMGRPKDLSSNSIDNEKISVLKKLRLYNDKRAQNIAIGQYRGYRDEEHVAKDSLTETHASIIAEINTPNWRKIPIILTSGKKLDDQTTDIIIRFKAPANHLWQDNGCRLENNQLHINIQPHNDIKLRLNFGSSPSNTCTLPIDLRFGFLDNNFIFKDAYENALKDIYNGDQSIFLCSTEILLSWKFIDTVLAKISKNRAKLLKIY